MDRFLTFAAMRWPLLFFAVFPFVFAAQQRLKATRINEKISVDAFSKENAWKTTSATRESFTTTRPLPGLTSSHPTEVKVLYDDIAIYFFVQCYDHPDSVSKVFSVRDDYNANADIFSIFIDTYNDQQNGFYFGITSSGVQLDGKILANDVNNQLNLVWLSKTQRNDLGWAAELKIPYSALRFAKKEVQDWNINFSRQIARLREESCWVPVKPDFENYLVQSGKLEGINNISPPLRLSLIPYISGYLNQENTTSYSRSIFGGMDVKYGINEAFTLDVTLVPDFGQVIFDNQVLNTTPFEQQFNENRQFFTEGMELFNKSGIFYSRRIGVQAPREVLSTNLMDNEVIYGVQGLPQLYNASKFSGRTKNGLGIGIFNAISAPTYGTAFNTITNNTREFLAAPLTNYNTFVFDQNLKKNSSVTLTNTNVWREGKFYDANVTAINSNFNFKENLYFINAKATLSQQFNAGSIAPGYNYGISTGKQRGNLIYTLNYFEEDDHYDNNDLGFNPVNNRRICSATASYRYFKPFWKFVRLRSSLSLSYNRLYSPNVYTESSAEWSAFALTKSFDAFGIEAYSAFTKKYDYFEPRSWGSYFVVPRWFGAGAWVSTNYQKSVAVDANFYYVGFANNSLWQNFIYSISPRIRASKKILLLIQLEFENQRHDRGFAVPFGTPTDTVNGILFGERTRNNLTQLLEFNYTVTNRINLSLRTRHYWSVLDYHNFFTLNQDGTLNSINIQGLDAQGKSAYNLNYNALTVDAAFRWVFQQGSELSFVWKSSVFSSIKDVSPSYFQNMQDLFNSGLFNSFSIKLLYWLDLGGIRMGKRN
ncbi:MAG: hypothetical protein EB023_09500 [Flavobacteriia bacterium]|nr:hypothetical protein [Flavobacteriia bacterium]